MNKFSKLLSAALAVTAVVGSLSIAPAQARNPMNDPGLNALAMQMWVQQQQQTSANAALAQQQQQVAYRNYLNQQAAYQDSLSQQYYPYSSPLYTTAYVNRYEHRWHDHDEWRDGDRFRDHDQWHDRDRWRDRDGDGDRYFRR